MDAGAVSAGEPVVVMGPTGTPSETPGGETVLLAGGGLGNAVLFSIAKAMRHNGNRVLYFAGYRKGEDLFKREEIEDEQFVLRKDRPHYSRDDFLKSIPLGRFPTAEEIAEAVCYLASDAAKSITGQTLVLDGGLVQRGKLSDGPGLA